MRNRVPRFEIRAAVMDRCSPAELIREAQRIGLQSRCCIVCLDADRIAGVRHAESAVRHGLRAWEAGTAIADSLEMEVLLYAGGTRQTSIGSTFGVRSDTTNLYLCFIPPSEEAITEIGYYVRHTEEDGENLTEEKVRRLAELFGITPAECEAVGRGRFQDLVIERVALLDVYR